MLTNIHTILTCIYKVVNNIKTEIVIIICFWDNSLNYRLIESWKKWDY